MIGEIPRPDHGAIAERARPLDHVLELAHVTGPGMSLEPRQGFGFDPLERTLAVPPEAAQEMMRKQAHVARPLAQRRQDDRDYVDTVEEIVAKLALPDQLGGIAIGRGHEADVHVHELGPADTTDLSLLEGPQ